MKLTNIIKGIKNPKIFLYYLDKLNLYRQNDEDNLKILYEFQMNKKLNLENPQTFNEKLQWLKLYDRKDVYTTMVDKYEAKKYVANIIGEEYIILTLGVYNKFEDINFDKLPNQFVIKCTHDSGSTIVCKDKAKFDVAEARNKIKKYLKRNFYLKLREWPYKNVKPRIIIEKYMEDKENKNLKDYKIFCFNGKPRFVLVCSNRVGRSKNTDFFDCDWNKMNFTRKNHKNSKENIEKPKKLNEMLEIARKISKNIPFIRVDLYEINGKIYFGELTFYPSAGFEGFCPDKYDKIIGDMLTLPSEGMRDIKDEK